MKDAGPAWMSIGRGSGQSRASDAAKEALASPLLEVSVQGARGVLFNVVGGSSLTLLEVNEAAEVIRQAVDPEANIIFGVAHDPDMDKEIRITLIATGFTSKKEMIGIGNEELTQQLASLRNNEDELDAPAFLRLPQFRHRRQIETVSTRIDKAPSPTPSPQSA